MRESVAVLILLLLFVPALAADPPIVVIKLNSVNAALGDLEAMGMFEDPEAEREQFLHEMVEPLRLPLGKWLDRNHPAFVLVSGAGFMGGPAEATTAMLPALDVDDALRALGGDPTTEPEDGVHQIAREDDGNWYIRIGEHDLIIGTNREQIASFDRAAIENLNFPSGNIGIDFNLEIVAPLIRGAIEMQRQNMIRQLKQGQTEPGRVPDAEQGLPDPQAVAGMMDFYFETIHTILDNTARFQLSLDRIGSDAIVRARVVPTEESELATLLAEQPVGFSKLSRAIPETPALVSYAGNLRVTDALVDGLGQWMDGYKRFLGQMAGIVPGMESLTDMITGQQKIALERLACMSGDMAGTMDLSADRGLASIQLAGVRDTEDCESLAEREVAMMRQILGPDGEPLIRVDEPNVAPGDIRAMRVELDLEGLLQDDPETAQTLGDMLGGLGTVTYYGQSDDVTISVAGVDAEQTFGEVVERLQSRRKHGGLTAEAFRPLEAGAGIFAVLDLSRLDLEAFLEQAGASQEPDTDDSAESGVEEEEDVPLTGRVVLGARAEEGNLAIDVVLPAEVLVRMVADEEHDDLPPDLWPPPPAPPAVEQEGSAATAETASDDDAVRVAGEGDVTLPVLVHKIKPDYPEILRQARLEGQVILGAIVNRQGTVSDIQLIQCEGKSLQEAEPRKNLLHESTFCTLLGDAAIAAVERWRYEPARQGDEPVDVYFTVHVDFELE